jgi:endoribonuclease LACTB2
MMPDTAGITIVNAGYRSTNYWLVSAGRARLLFDIGWPGTMGTMRATLQRLDAPLHEIRYAVASHYHIDHAGVAQEMKLAGVPLLVIDLQAAAIPLMKQHTKPQDHYLDITTHDNTIITCAQSRALLAAIGIAGEIVHTPGHSDDSVSLLLDSGDVFTGDLPPEQHAWDNPVALATWAMLRRRGARHVYPAHGPVWAM